MDVVIETERLLLRRFTTDDAGLIYQLNRDPEVTRYTLDPVRDEAHAREVLEKVILPQYAMYNHGRWAVHSRADLSFLGWCGLKFRAERNEIDLGYRYNRESWGRGYATEAAYACLEYGFKKLMIRRILGRALPGNSASIRVLEKCGMKYLGEETIDGLLHKTYEALSPLIPGSGR